MSKSDWIDVGLRLLGVFFIINGSLALWRTIVVLAAATGRGVGDASIGYAAVMIAPPEILAGIALLFIRWPGDNSAALGKKRAAPLPEHMEEMFDQMEQGKATDK